MNRESLELLEYERLRALVRRYVASEPGRSLLDSVAPACERESLVEDLNEAAEAIAYLKDTVKPKTRGGQAPARLRFEGLPDVAPSSARLRIEGAVLEPMAVAFHAAALAAVRPGETVAVFGAGAIGILVAAFARLCGAGAIFIADRLQYRLDFAAAHYGIDGGINTVRENPLERIRVRTAGRGADVVFEAAGDQQTFDWTFEAARIGGRCAIIGIPELDTLTVDPHLWRRKELLVRNVRRSNRGDLDACIALASRKTVPVDKIATHRFPLDRASDAFETVAGYRDNVVRALVTHG